MTKRPAKASQTEEGSRKARGMPRNALDRRWMGSSGVPLLFETAKRQRFLAYLSHKGPSRLVDVMRAIDSKSFDSIKTLADNGLVIWDNRNRTTTFVALNPRFPAIPELVVLLRRLEPRSSFHCSLSPTRTRMPTKRVASDPSQLFGGNSSTRTRALVALHVLGGSGSAVQIADAVGGTSHQIILKLMRALQRAGIIKESGSPVTFTFVRAQWTPALRSALGTLNRHFKIVARARTPRRFGKGGAGHHKTLDYRKPVVSQEKPSTYRPPSDGAPLLFGTDARRRLLCALSSGKPIYLPDAANYAQLSSYDIVYELERSGLVVRFGERGNQYVLIHPLLPGRVAFCALLRKLRIAFSPHKTTPRSRHVDMPTSYTWDIRRPVIFGKLEQTETLIVLSEVHELDGSFLCAAMPSKQGDYQTLRRLLFKLVHQGVLRQRKLGRIKLFSLHPHFVAASELRRFLLALSQHYPKYRAAARSLAFQRTERARALRTTQRAKVSYPPAIDIRFPPQ